MISMALGGSSKIDCIKAEMFKFSVCDVSEEPLEVEADDGRNSFVSDA